MERDPPAVIPDLLGNPEGGEKGSGFWLEFTPISSGLE